jgi:hypothetical protein
MVNEQTNNITEEFTVMNNNKNSYIEENFILDTDMKQLDNLKYKLDNFKSVVGDVKKNTSDYYDKQGSDSEALEKQAEEAKGK